MKFLFQQITISGSTPLKGPQSQHWTGQSKIKHHCNVKSHNTLLFSRVAQGLIAPALLIFMLSGCFKQEVPVIGPPDDIIGDTLIAPPASTTNYRKVLIVGLNGCMGSAVRVAQPPNITGLLKNAIYSYDALSDAPPENGPGWASMLTGVWPDKHGVTEDMTGPGFFDTYPSVFKYVKVFNPKAVIASVTSTPDLNKYLAKEADIKINTPGNDKAAADSTVQLLNKGKTDLVFLNLSGIQQAGIEYGFDSTVSGYLDAINKADGYLGQVFSAVQQREKNSHEDWLIVICSDFGAASLQSADAQKNIFVAFSNKQFAKEQIVPPTTDLKSIRFNDIGQFGEIRHDFYDFDSLTQFSVDFKIRAEKLNNGNMPAIVGNKDWNSGGNPGWVIYANKNVIGVNMGDGKGHRADFENTTAPPVDDNMWHHICLTVDRKGDAKLYQDGILYNTTSVIRIANLMTNSDVKLVVDDDITESFGSRYGNASFNIGDLRIWGTALDEAAVLYYATACDTVLTQKDPDIAQLLSWWKGTEGSGNALKDSKGLFDMTLVNQPKWEHQLFSLCNEQLPPSVPTLVDIMPCVLQWFNIQQDSGWQLDGITWIQR